MRTILAHLESSPVLPSLLRCAWLLGEHDGTYIEGLHMRPSQPDVIAAGADGFIAAAPDLIAGFEQEARERAERAIAAFTAFMAEHGLARTGDPGAGDGPLADWRIETAGGQAAIGQRGRLFDAIVVGRPLRDHPAPSVAALESALFDSGRPILVAPPNPPETMGRHVVVAWNGASETARTLAFGRSLLRAAERVTVLTVEGGSVAGPSGEELVVAMKRGGIDASMRHAARGDATAGERVLAETTAIGGDLLLKGAYTQSRLRQMIFGGVTSHILANAELPVFMAN